MIRRAALAAVLALACASGALAQVNKVPDAQLQKHLDEHYPFLEQGAEPPGRWVPNESRPGSSWSCKMGWRTRNGPAIVWWSLGKPNRVDAARYPDGSRGIAQHVLDHGWRRRAPDGRRWVHGTIDILPDDAVFADGQQPVYVPLPHTDGPNLEADLARDAVFLAALQDDRFAQAVYTTLRNRTLYKGADERSWSCGDSDAAHMMAGLPGRGESYQDYYAHGVLSGVYPDDRPDHEAFLGLYFEPFSQPFSLERMIPPWLRPDQTEELRKQLEAQRQELEQQLKSIEPERGEALQAARRALARLDENADVFHALRDHLTSLGWRSETAEDRARAQRARLTQGVALLQELKTLQQRPEAVPDEWSERLRQSLARQQAQGGLQVLVERPIASGGQNSAPNMTDDEREIRSGGLRRRVNSLATSGRVSKDEYDGLLQRLGKLRF